MPHTDCTVSVSEEEAGTIFRKLNPRRAAGPDGLRGRDLKDCAVFVRLFQLLPDTSSVPLTWKTSTIIPAAEEPRAKGMSDFRPMALTPIVSRYTEKVTCKQLTASLSHQTDLSQFAYKAERGVEDTGSTLLRAVSQTFNLLSVFGHLSVRSKAKLSRVVSQGNKTTGCTQTQLAEHHAKAVNSNNKILDDTSHPLHTFFEMMPSGRRVLKKILYPHCHCAVQQQLTRNQRTL